MKRIFLLIDDFTELTFLETLLKKVGFDALGSQSSQTAVERAMQVTPEVLILSDIIKSQSTHDVMDSIRKYRPNVHIILLKRDLKYVTPHNIDFIAATIRSPVDPELFLRTIAKVADINDELVIEKFHRLGLFKGAKLEEKLFVQNTAVGENANENVFIKSLKESENAAAKDESRKKRFESVKNLPDPKVAVVDHKIAMKEMQEFRGRSGDPEIQNIDEVRKNFVKALFKPKS